MLYHTLEEQRVNIEEALEEAQAKGNKYWEAMFRRMLYNLLLVDSPIEDDLVSSDTAYTTSTASTSSQATTSQWPVQDANKVASLMEQVQAMPSGQDWLEMTSGKLMVPACPPDLRPASFKQQLGEAMQNHENTLAVQEGRKSRKFNYSKWVFRA